MVFFASEMNSYKLCLGLKNRTFLPNKYFLLKKYKSALRKGLEGEILY